jgi:hypothetical protein
MTERRRRDDDEDDEDDDDDDDKERNDDTTEKEDSPWPPSYNPRTWPLAAGLTPMKPGASRASDSKRPEARGRPSGSRDRISTTNGVEWFDFRGGGEERRGGEDVGGRPQIQKSTEPHIKSWLDAMNRSIIVIIASAYIRVHIRVNVVRHNRRHYVSSSLDASCLDSTSCLDASCLDLAAKESTENRSDLSSCRLSYKRFEPQGNPASEYTDKR